MANFITNSKERNLAKRLNQLITASKELKFLVGFFYFSGIRNLYTSLKGKENFTLKILVGLNVDKISNCLIEYSFDEKLSENQKIEKFFESIKKSINSDVFDNKEFYEQSKFFIDLIIKDKIIIRQTLKPNHAKLYLFKLEEEQISRNRLFITGSSNLTNFGLNYQDEFNVEISDYGFDEAEEYFDKLWEEGILITECSNVKEELINIITNETLIREVTPFEAYCLVLKSYIESFECKDLELYILELLEKNGYKRYNYQLDAVKQALAIIEKHNGVLIADVVGLGKTIIACIIAKHLRKRGIVICPPSQIGDRNKTVGWKKYLEEFQLYDWEVRSLGALEETLKFVKSKDDIEVIIVDEAHRFRNEDTEGYELLKNICRGKKVILLTATPFNNRPQDVLSILKLFIIPKKSTITLDNNVYEKFKYFNRLFNDLSDIKKYYNHKDKSKRNLAQTKYKSIFGGDEIALEKVKSTTHYLAKQIRDVIEPIIIRRNRLDLKKHPLYQNEINELSIVDNPKEWFFELTEEQSKFYDEIISEYFGSPENGGKFKGAIYMPFNYEKEIKKNKESEITKEENREYIQQRNLFDIMRRLLVKRFESSFGAFYQSVLNFINIFDKIIRFIEKTGNGDKSKGKYILDRNLLEKILELESDEIEEQLKNYQEQNLNNIHPKKHKIYEIENFQFKEEFISDIESDRNLFVEIKTKLENLKLIENDPKSECLFKKLIQQLRDEPNRKIVIFTEYADTVEHLRNKLEKCYPEIYKKTMFVKGDIPINKIKKIISNFDAAIERQENDYQILISTDKISEGFNLNRAGMVINYDIPWNPVRVIQRLGRINRISKKVFDELYIVNFFPTEIGAEFVKSREIAQNKMFMIHNTLGEDSKIFDIDEEPTPSNLYSRLNKNPEEYEAESFITKVYSLYNEIKTKYPEVINSLNNFPVRVKVCKPYDENHMILVFKKNQIFIKIGERNNNKFVINDVSLEDVLEKIQCDINTPNLDLTEEFWELYQEMKTNHIKQLYSESPTSLYSKAINILNFIIRKNIQIDEDMKSFCSILREDLIDYGTLPDFTVRRIANIKPDEDIQLLKSHINEIRNNLGDDYLQKEKEKLIQKEKEIIIAIYNLNLENH